MDNASRTRGQNLLGTPPKGMLPGSRVTGSWVFWSQCRNGARLIPRFGLRTHNGDRNGRQAQSHSTRPARRRLDLHIRLAYCPEYAPWILMLFLFGREVSDVERIDMILESPRSAFKDVFAKRQPVNHRVVGTLGMVSIIYLYTCAGPIGSEPIVSAGGPLAAMFALLVYPLLVTIPYAYIVAELCSAFPEDGGFTIWVLNAFGPYWGFQVGYWSWISGVIRTALIPDTILNLFLAFYDTKIESTAVELFVKAGIAIVLTFPACFGTRNATRLSCFLLVVVIVPFFTYTIWAYVKTSEVGEIFDVRHEVTYYDRDIDDAILEGDVDIRYPVDDPSQHLVLQIRRYLHGLSLWWRGIKSRTNVPARHLLHSNARHCHLLVSIASVHHCKQTQLGLLRSQRVSVHGRRGWWNVLKSFVLVASVAGAFGTFISGIYMKAFQVSGMAGNRLLPPVFALRGSRFGTPHHAIVATAIATVALLPISFDDLLPLSNAFAAAVEFTIIVAAMRLRMTLPYIPRPTKVPGGILGLLIFAGVPAVVLGYILVHTFMTSLIATLLMVGLLLFGLINGIWSTRWG